MNALAAAAGSVMLRKPSNSADLFADGLLYAGHDISDGGVITCLLEMAFAGNCSVDADFSIDDTGLRHNHISAELVPVAQLN